VCVPETNFCSGEGELCLSMPCCDDLECHGTYAGQLHMNLHARSCHALTCQIEECFHATCITAHARTASILLPKLSECEAYTIHSTCPHPPLANACTRLCRRSHVPAPAPAVVTTHTRNVCANASAHSLPDTAADTMPHHTTIGPCTGAHTKPSPPPNGTTDSHARAHTPGAAS
jgi:hypothetical protein